MSFLLIQCISWSILDKHETVCQPAVDPMCQDRDKRQVSTKSRELIRDGRRSSHPAQGTTSLGEELLCRTSPLIDWKLIPAPSSQLAWKKGQRSHHLMMLGGQRFGVMPAPPGSRVITDCQPLGPGPAPQAAAVPPQLFPFFMTIFSAFHFSRPTKSSGAHLFFSCAFSRSQKRNRDRHTCIHTQSMPGPTEPARPTRNRNQRCTGPGDHPPGAWDDRQPWDRRRCPQTAFREQWDTHVTICKLDSQGELTYDAGHWKPVLWQPGVMGWRGRRAGFRREGLLHTCGQFVLLYGKNHCNVAK